MWSMQWKVCLALVAATAAAQDVTLHKSASKFHMTFTQSEELLSTSSVFKFESISADYFQQLLISPALSQVINQDILTTDVNVEDQGYGDDLFAGKGSGSSSSGLTLKSSVVVTYAGEDSISDLASLLSMIVREKRGVELLELLIKDGVVGNDALGAKISFSTPDDPNKAESSFTVTVGESDPTTSESGKQTSLVVVCVILALCLLCVSLLLVWAVGGFKKCDFDKMIGTNNNIDEYSRDYDGSGRLGAKPSIEEDDEENIPPATITMDPRKNGLTPRKGFYHEDKDTSRVLTPLSLADESNISKSTEDQSVMSRQGLGIRSMSKLKRTLTPQKDQQTVAVQISKILD